MLNASDRIQRCINTIAKILKARSIKLPTKAVFCADLVEQNFFDGELIYQNSSRRDSFIPNGIQVRFIRNEEQSFLAVMNNPRFCDQSSKIANLSIPWILASLGVEEFLFVHPAEKINPRLKLSEAVIPSEQFNISGVDPFEAIADAFPAIRTNRDQLYSQEMIAELLNGLESYQASPRLVSEAFHAGLQNMTRLEYKLFAQLEIDIVSRYACLENNFLFGIGKKAVSLAIINRDSHGKSNLEDERDAFAFGLQKNRQLINHWLNS